MNRYFCKLLMLNLQSQLSLSPKSSSRPCNSTSCASNMDIPARPAPVRLISAVVVLCLLLLATAIALESKIKPGWWRQSTLWASVGVTNALRDAKIYEVLPAPSPLPSVLPRQPPDAPLFRANASLAPCVGGTTPRRHLRQNSGGWGTDKGDCAFFPVTNSERLAFARVMLLEVVDVVRRHSLRMGSEGPLLAGGSLIGAIRNGEMVPWTEDNDLDISSSLFHSISGNTALRDDLYERGYHVFMDWCGRVCAHAEHPRIRALGNFRECSPLQTDIYSQRAHTYVDLYPSGLLDGGWLRWTASSLWLGELHKTALSLNGCEGVEPSDYLPPSRVRYMGHEFLAPAKPEKLLCKLWGSGWRTPTREKANLCNQEPQLC